MACALLASLAAIDARGSGLFEETAEMAVVLEFPVQRMLRTKRKREELPATLHFQGPDGARMSVPLKVRPRGHTRLESCDLPPLRLEFDPAQVAGTPFAGQRQLKLVTQCREPPRYADYVRLEQRIYQAYALVAPVALRTRALAVNYVDPTEHMLPLKGPAFVIEDVDDLVKRAGLRKAKVQALNPPDVDAAQVTLVELFQFMIGNTDWSVHLPMDGEEECCHNSRVLGPGPGKYVVVPYDFDQSGLINAEYAAVSPVVGVSHVRQRIYRGICSRNAFVPAAIQRLQEVRPQLEALFQGGGLRAAASRSALGYLESFYSIVEDPEQVRRQIYGYCRPDPAPGSTSAATGAATVAPSDASSRGRLP